jgi:pseudouridine synthase
MAERLQKVLSQWGVASRRRAEGLIQQGRVTVNGRVAELGLKVDPSQDHIVVDGLSLGPQQRPSCRYLLLHKPLGVVSTCADPGGRTTVLEVLKNDLGQTGLHPVGRLDAYSTGALLLTNDGDFTYRLTHPKHDISKTYRVWVEGSPRPADLEAWRQGIELEGRLTRPAKVEVLNQDSPQRTLLEVVLWEGRNRQIRRVAQALGHRVLSLHRTAIGPICLGKLAPGEYRSLSQNEVAALLAEATIPTAGQLSASQPPVQSTRY